MNIDIHPNCKMICVNCNCGNKFEIFSSLSNKDLVIEVCNACHPFYTGKQKIIDVSGRVDNFYKKFNRIKSNKKL